MKVRTGFVSNSSSSSFVLVGFEVDRSELEELTEAAGFDEDCVDEFVYELGLSFHDGEDAGVPGAVLGSSISEGEYGLEQNDLSLNSLFEIDEINKAKSKFKTAEDLKLYVGEYCC